MRLRFAPIFFVMTFLMITAVAPLSKAAVVTIEGIIHQVEPAKREIYVLADGKKNEFYFSDKTEITKDGAPVAFEMLKKARKVRVTADKIGKRLDPLKVELLD